MVFGCFVSFSLMINCFSTTCLFSILRYKGENREIGFYDKNGWQVKVGLANGVMYFSILICLNLDLVILCFFDGIFLDF